MAGQDKSLMTLKESDLKENCYRLNRRFQIIEQLVFSSGGGGDANQNPGPNNPANLTNPVDLNNLNQPPGQPGQRPAGGNPQVTYGPHQMRLDDYVAQYHPGELFVETDRGRVIYQSQLVVGVDGSFYDWILLP